MFNTDFFEFIVFTKDSLQKDKYRYNFIVSDLIVRQDNAPHHSDIKAWIQPVTKADKEKAIKEIKAKSKELIEGEKDLATLEGFQMIAEETNIFFCPKCEMYFTAYLCAKCGSIIRENKHILYKQKGVKLNWYPSTWFQLCFFSTKGS